MAGRLLVCGKYQSSVRQGNPTSHIGKGSVVPTWHRTLPVQRKEPNSRGSYFFLDLVVFVLTCKLCEFREEDCLLWQEWFVFAKTLTLFTGYSEVPGTDVSVQFEMVNVPWATRNLQPISLSAFAVSHGSSSLDAALLELGSAGLGQYLGQYLSRIQHCVSRLIFQSLYSCDAATAA